MSRPWRLIPVLAALALAACGEDPPEVKDPVCGNGAVETGEVCDDGNTVSGDGCRADCKGTEVCGDGLKDDGEVCDDGNTVSGDGCRADCKGVEACGDSLKDPGEECDQGAANSDTTPNACRTNCKLPSCGDGVKDNGEGCDEGENNNDTAPSACRTNCALSTCGDGIKDADEQCDNGAENNDDVPNACRTTCLFAFCGDGVLDNGEACDNGANNSNTEPNACRTTCQPADCGDGVVDDGEACDDGANNSDSTADACRTDCSEPICGDGTVDTGEQCDEGNNNSDTAPNACREDCVLPTCGDGVADNGEECDEGLANSDTAANACRTDCSAADCGDGVVDSGEACDDGANNSDTAADACRTSCVEATCGDGVVDSGEACDEGANNSDTTPNACRTACVAPTCGDGVADDGEACDDGNAEINDGCTPACQAEIAGSTCEYFFDLNTDGLQSDGTWSWSADSSLLGAELEASCGNSGNSPDGVARFVAPADGVYSVSSMAPFDSVLWAWQGTCPSVPYFELGCADRQTSGKAEMLSLTLTQGQTVFVVVDGYGTDSAGEFTLTLAPLSCGDGILAPAEGCDDANDTDGDGCTACVVDVGWACPTAGQPCREIVCGDGHVDAPETCDDNNQVAGDGCSPTCRVEVEGDDCGTAFVLEAVGTGPWAWSADTSLFTADFDADAVDSACANSASQRDGITEFTAPADGTYVFELEAGVDSVLFVWDLCDPATATSLGCADVGGNGGERISLDLSANETVFVGVDAYGSGTPGSGSKHGPFTLTVTPIICGDGILAGSEACDDGNATDGDGCTACVVDDGWVCPAGEACHEMECGDGVAEGSEACDDGNTTDGDGCSSSCVLEIAARGSARQLSGSLDATDPTWARRSASCGNSYSTSFFDTYEIVNATGADQQITITAQWSGDGFLHLFSAPFDPSSPATNCIVGNDDFGGSSGSQIANRTIAAGEVLVIVASTYGTTATGAYTLDILTIRPQECGDGFVDGSEACDDGNTVDNDGCTACVIDVGYACPTAGQDCHQIACGDGFLDGSEACDDGNTVDDDGCTACVIDDGYACPTGDQPCHQISCGDGFVDPPESCDDGNQVDGDGCSASCVLEIAAPSSTVQISGSLDSTDPTWSRANATCGTSTFTPYFDAYEIVNNTGADQQITISANWLGDGFLHLFRAPFDPATPTANCIIGNDGSGTTSQISNQTIVAGETLVVIATSYYGARALGAYTIDVLTLRPQACGDSFVDGTETCDDGNTVGGDGCSATCQLEIVGNTCELAFDLNAQTQAGPWSWSADTSAFSASYDAEEVDYSCSQSSSERDGIASFTAPADGDYLVELEADFDSVLFVWDVCDPATAASLGCDDGYGNGGESLSLTLTAGQTVFIGVDGYDGYYGTEEGPFTLTVTPLVCGDGVLAVGEACDDGNTLDADGCTACAIDPGWICETPGQTCREIVCGDGIIDAGEACDDGNLIDGDGCTGCVIDTGWICEGLACHQVVCGDGVIEAGESCEDGNQTDGCSANCILEIPERDESMLQWGSLDTTDRLWNRPGANCGTGLNFPNRYFDEIPLYNGTGVDQQINVRVHWSDTGFLFVFPYPFDPESRDACVLGASATSHESELREVSIPAGGTITLIVSGSTESDAQGLYALEVETIRPPLCGDGLIEGRETCDDGGLEDGDGCSAACEIEIAARGATVQLVGSLDATDPTWSRASPTCGTSNQTPYFDAYEIVNNTGVDQQITISANWLGDGFLSLFRAPFNPATPTVNCVTGHDGNGTTSQISNQTIVAGETLVVIATSYYSARALGAYTIDVLTIRPPECGDGIIDAPEVCDDGNTDPDDGCAADCRSVTAGYVCDVPGSACRQIVCGDGILEGDETCDDHNLEDGDGCSAFCELEIAQPNGSITFAESLDTTDRTWARPSESCGTGSSGRYYDAFSIVNNTGAAQLLTVTAAWSGDGFLHMFRAPFDASSPLTGCIKGNDDLNDRYDSQISGLLINDGEVLVVVASAYSGNTATGSYSIEVATQAPVCGDGKVTGGEECDGGEGCTDTCQLVVATPFEATFSGFDAVTANERALVSVTAKAPSDIDPAASLRWRLSLTDASSQPVAGIQAFYYANLPSDVLEDHLTWTASITTDENGQAWFGPETGFTAGDAGLLDPAGLTTPMSVVLPAGTLTLRLELVELAGLTTVGESSVEFTVAVPPPPGTLMFSEYTEGSGSNKAFELYNGSSAAIDLSTCVVKIYANGATTSSNIPLPSQTIEAGGVLAMCNPSATATLLAACGGTHGGITFNGNDVLEVSCSSVVLDVLGQIGSSDNFGADVTLRRKCGTAGDVDGSDVFDPTVNWDALAMDDWSGFGSHTCP